MSLLLRCGGFVWIMCAMASPSFGQLIVAHRGASHDAPENTLPAFKLAIEQGADAFDALNKGGELFPSDAQSITQVTQVGDN